MVRPPNRSRSPRRWDAGGCPGRTAALFSIDRGTVLGYLLSVIAGGILFGLIDRHRVVQRSADFARRLSAGSPLQHALLAVIILIAEFAALEGGLRASG